MFPIEYKIISKVLICCLLLMSHKRTVPSWPALARIFPFAAYLKLEGYYVVFDHREKPCPQVETESMDGVTIQSYIIPVLQQHPSGKW